MSMTDFSGTDFDLALGEVYGLRAWRMDGYGRLRALHVPSSPAWRPGVNTARCYLGDVSVFPSFLSAFFAAGGPITGRRIRLDEAERQVDKKPDPVPQEGCSCGFYAYTDLKHDENKADADNKYVLGVIRGTGRTLIGTKGFRCEKAEIVALLDPTRGGLRLAAWRRQQRRNLRRVYPDALLVPTRRELVAVAPIERLLPDPADDAFWSLP